MKLMSDKSHAPRRWESSFQRVATFGDQEGVYDWRWRLKEETGKFGWMRLSRLLCRDYIYMFLSPQTKILHPYEGVKLWAALVQSSQGERGLWAVDVKEKVYVECNGEFFELGQCLTKAWYDHLGKVAHDQGLQPYPADPAVFYVAR